MARSVINLGVAPTGQGGDTFRTASQKNNDNSAELYARQALLGTASNANLTVGTSDVTAGRVLKVSDYGLGSLNVISGPGLNDIGSFGFYYVTGSSGGPSGFPNGWLTVLPINTSYIIQNFRTEVDGSYFTRAKIAGTWLAWRKIYDSGNTTRAADGTLKAI
ncbi:pyocin knob domain-containing protein [Pseudomonas fluorescens]